METPVNKRSWLISQEFLLVLFEERNNKGTLMEPLFNNSGTRHWQCSVFLFAGNSGSSFEPVVGNVVTTSCALCCTLVSRFGQRLVTLLILYNTRMFDELLQYNKNNCPSRDLQHQRRFSIPFHLNSEKILSLNWAFTEITEVWMHRCWLDSASVLHDMSSMSTA